MEADLQIQMSWFSSLVYVDTPMVHWMKQYDAKPPSVYGMIPGGCSFYMLNYHFNWDVSSFQLLKLQGKSKWGKEEINIIDVHADHQTSAVELTKHLTEEVDMVSHSKKKKDQPTSQQKRKHQITYLAHRVRCSKQALL